MAADDLRTFLTELEQSGQLLTFDDEVAAEPDLAAAARAVTTVAGPTAPALLFEAVAGFEQARVALNVHGSWRNHALVLGLPPDTPVRRQFDVLRERWASYPVPIEQRSDAPWAETAVTDDDINLFELLPVFRINPGDAGPYIDKAAVITRSPDATDGPGATNVGIYRLQVKGPRTLGIQVAAPHDMQRHVEAAARAREGLPIAIAIGNDPVLTLAASTPLDYGQSEYEMAGAWRGGTPYPVATGPLTGLTVPWGSEVLLEGRVHYEDREFEGPFGEFTGHYSGGRRLPTVTVDRVSARKNPIYEALHLGVPWTEIDYLIGLTTSVPIFEQLRRDFPEVRAVNAMYTHGLVTIISTATRHGGFGRVVGLRALTVPHGIGYSKIVIVVDDTVDPFNLEQVMWALSVKFNPAHDLVEVPRMYEVPLDPSGDPAGITSRIVLDATTARPPDVRGGENEAVEVAPFDAAASWEERIRELLA